MLASIFGIQWLDGEAGLPPTCGVYLVTWHPPVPQSHGDLCLWSHWGGIIHCFRGAGTQWCANSNGYSTARRIGSESSEDSEVPSNTTHWSCCLKWSELGEWKYLPVLPFTKVTGATDGALAALAQLPLLKVIACCVSWDVSIFLRFSMALERCC